LAASGADEAIFLNERDELCEGARTNLFVPRGGLLLTPPLSSGLLPGVLRASLLADGRARESLLRLPDLDAGFFLGNSLRGLLPAQLAP
jgi:branched-subunit amino acid aminotransferase/4-amino-4-deoxychorismate lyase